MKKVISSLLLLTLIYSCSNNNTTTDTTTTDSVAVKPELDKLILGTWDNTTLKVKINTALNTDSTGFIDVDESNWERVLKSKPMTTVFGDDNSYRLEYKGANDSVVIIASGTWYVLNDSIFMNQKQPDATFFQYQVSLNENMATLSGLVDWEGDGKVDDEYSGTLRKK